MTKHDFSTTCLALRVDIDTFSGLQKGLPRLLNLFSELDIRATFFVPAGPDRSGLALRRVLCRKGFLKRMWKIGAPRIYGWRTMFAGTLLPSKYLVREMAEFRTQFQGGGHRLGLHGYDHFDWQDAVDRWSVEHIRQLIQQGVSSFEHVLEITPREFAVPGWIFNKAVARALDHFDWEYASDCRGATPFYPIWPDYQSQTLQVPVTLPTIDELLVEMSEPAAYQILTNELTQQQMAVHTIHTEIEGQSGFAAFQEWLMCLQDNGCRFIQLADVAADIRASSAILTCEILRENVPGRFDRVAIQGKEVT